jgi:hypothetical protein
MTRLYLYTLVQSISISFLLVSYRFTINLIFKEFMNTSSFMQVQDM